jgi:hypothetical protein
MEWLQLPHWLMIAGTLLVIAGLIGLVMSRMQQAKVQDDPATEQSPEPRPRLSPLPDLLDSRPRENRRSMLSDEEHPPGRPPHGWDRAEGEEMSEPKTGLASLGLDNAIRLRWVLRDLIGRRLKFSPIAPNDLQTLIELGYIEMKDEVPTFTIAGLDEIATGNLPSDRGAAEGEK